MKKTKYIETELNSSTFEANNWQWKVGSIQNALKEAGEEWHQLWLTSGDPPMALPMWYASMHEAFGNIGGQVSVHRLYTGTRLVAVLPLTLSKNLCRSWQSYQNPLYTPFWALALDNDVKGVGQEIRRHLLSNAEVIDLKYILTESACFTRLLEEIKPNRMLIQSDPDEADIYNPLDGSWEQCVEHLSPKLVLNTKQSIRRLKRQGELKLSVVTDPDNLEPSLTDCLKLEASGWKGKKGTAIHCLPKVEKFYRGLAIRAAEAGFLAIYMLLLDEQLISFVLSLRTKKRIDVLKIGYDETLSRESPGNVLIYMILEKECSDGRYKNLHWGSPTVHKKRWTHCSKRLVRVRLFSDTLRGKLSYGAYALAWPAVKGVCRKLKK